MVPENFTAQDEYYIERAEDELRLSGDMIPSHYAIELKPNLYDPNGEFEFWGKVSITMTSHKTTKTLILHMFDLNIINSSIAVGQLFTSDKRLFMELRDDY